MKIRFPKTRAEKIKEIVEKGNVIFKTFRVSDKYCGYVNN